MSNKGKGRMTSSRFAHWTSAEWKRHEDKVIRPKLIEEGYLDFLDNERLSIRAKEEPNYEILAPLPVPLAPRDPGMGRNQQLERERLEIEYQKEYCNAMARRNKIEREHIVDRSNMWKAISILNKCCKLEDVEELDNTNGIDTFYDRICWLRNKYATNNAVGFTGDDWFKRYISLEKPNDSPSEVTKWYSAINRLHNDFDTVFGCTNTVHHQFKLRLPPRDRQFMPVQTEFGPELPIPPEENGEDDEALYLQEMTLNAYTPCRSKMKDLKMMLFRARLNETLPSDANFASLRLELQKGIRCSFKTVDEIMDSLSRANVNYQKSQSTNTSSDMANAAQISAGKSKPVKTSYRINRTLPNNPCMRHGREAAYHPADQCRDILKEGKVDRQTQRSGAKRSWPDSSKCQYCNTHGHAAKDCPQIKRLKASAEQARIADTDMANHARVLPHSSLDQFLRGSTDKADFARVVTDLAMTARPNTAILDSGATRVVSPLKSRFVNLRPTRAAISIANGV
ncbi:hypothetical protein DFJ73DRAFT_764170 [Zopfochytrium polystomum]|nr:hypothetical protein DFJ73DRAFT_764170 [Zopfochytrium polystomum]